MKRKGGNAHSERTTTIMITQTAALSLCSRYSGNLNHAEHSAHSLKYGTRLDCKMANDWKLTIPLYHYQNRQYQTDIFIISPQPVRSHRNSQKQTKQKQHKVHAGHLKSSKNEASDAEVHESGKEFTMECPALEKPGSTHCLVNLTKILNWPFSNACSQGGRLVQPAPRREPICQHGQYSGQQKRSLQAHSESPTEQSHLIGLNTCLYTEGRCKGTCSSLKINLPTIPGY